MAYLKGSPQDFVHGMRAWLAAIIAPHVTECDDDCQVHGIWTHGIDLGEGVRVYTVNEAAPAEVMHAIDAESDLRVLELHINSDRPDLRFVIGSTFALTQLVRQAIEPRDERLTEVAQKFLDGCAKGGRATAKLTEEQKARARELFEKMTADRVSEDGAFTRIAEKLKAEFKVEVSKSTVRRAIKE